MAKEKDNTTQKIDNQNRLNDSLKKQQEILGQIYALESDGLDAYADRLNLQEQLYTNAKILATVSANIDKFSESTSDRAKMLSEQYTTHRDLLDEVQSKYTDIVLNSNNITEDSFEVVDLAKEHGKLMDAMLETELARDVLGEKEYNKQKELLEFIKNRLNFMDEINNSQAKGNELAKKFLDENTMIGGTIGNTLDGITKMATKFGDQGLIGRVLGSKASKLIDKARADIKDKIIKAFQQSGEAGVSAFSMTRMAAGSFVKYALPALGIAGILGIFYGIINSVKHLDQEIANVAKNFTASRSEAEKIHHASVDIANEMGLVGINSEQVMNAMKETSGILNGLSVPAQFSAGNQAVKDMVKDVTVLSEKFGLSSEEIDNIATLSAITKKPMGELVNDSVKMGKGLLGTKKSLEVIGKISPSMAMNFKKGGMELLKAAQKAKLLGMELEDVQNFGEGILDFENSLEKEMEARVLTGKNLNFDLARQYALNNDIAGLQEEMLSQLGSSAEFESMNFLQRKSIAEAFGMTVDQVAKLLGAQEKLNDLGISQQKMDEIQKKNAEDLAQEAKTTTNAKLKGYLQELAKQKQVETINNRINDAMQKIKEVLSATLAPLLEQVQHFLDSAEGAEFIKGTIEGIKSLMTGLVSLGKMFATGIAKINSLFGGTGSAVAIIAGLFGTIATYFVGKALIVKGIKSLVSGIGNASGAASTLAGNMQNVASATSNISGGSGGLASAGSGFTSFAQNAAGVAILLIAFAGALWITSKAFENFAKIDWDGIKKGLGVMAGLTIAVGILAGIGIAANAALPGLAGMALVLVAFGAALYASAKSFEIMSKINWKGFDGMLGAIGSVVGSFAKLGATSILVAAGALALTAAGASILVFASGMWLLAKALKNLSQVGDLKGVGANLANGMSELSKIPNKIDLKSIKATFKDLRLALAQLNIEKLVQFGELAKADLSKAGANIVEGIKSLGQVSTSIDLGGDGFLGMGKSGITKQLSDFDDAIGELSLDGVKAFAEIAKTDFTNVGKNINVGIQSLRDVKTDGAKDSLLAVEDVFDWFEDALRELDYEQIQQFVSTGIGGATKFVDGFNEFLKKLATLPRGTANIIGGFKYYMQLFSDAVGSINFDSLTKLTSFSMEGAKTFAQKFSEFVEIMYKSGGNTGKTLQHMRYHFYLLNEAIKQLDISKLKEFSQVNSDSIKKIASVFQQPQNVNVSGNVTSNVTQAPPGGESEQSKTNKKMDKMIDLLEKLLAGLNQPTIIKLGDRTIENIAISTERLKQQNPTKSGGRMVDVVGGR